MLGRNDENIQGGGYPLLRGLGRGLRRALGACLTVAALIAATAGGAYADDLLETGDAGTTAGASKVADGDEYDDTRYTYTGDNGSGVLGGETSTRYNGRVWTDKTVTTIDQTFKDPNDSQGQTTTPVTVHNDSDFLVTYSALATTTREYESHPTDTVFVLDFSHTMNRLIDGTEIQGDVGQIRETRMVHMLEALDGAIHALVEADGNNRVGVVTFYGSNPSGQTTPKVLLDMTKASSITAADGVTVPEEGWTPISGGKQQGAEGNVYTSPHGYFTIDKFWYGDDASAFTKTSVKCNIREGNTVVTGVNTPIQAGLYDAMTMFDRARVDNTEKVTPNIVLLTDGNPTSLIMNDDNWYEDIDTSLNPKWRGDHDAPAFFGTVLMAAYAKRHITNEYAENCNFYTIGFNTGTGDEARFALDPGYYVEHPEEATSDSVKKSLAAWNEYHNAGEDQNSVTITMNNTANNVTFAIARDSEYHVVPENINYADTYYPVENADDLADAFSEIAGGIVASAKVPTQVGEDPAGSGWIEYEDQIGEYMEVKDVKTLIYMGRTITDKTKSTTDEQGNTVTTYQFKGGVIDNPAYPGVVHDTSEIQIQLLQDEQGEQKLRVRIPASAIPLRVNNIVTNTIDGQITNTVSNGLPLRLCYTVGLRDNVNRYSLQGVDEDYVKANKNGNQVLFYSNAFTKEDERIRAGATVTFTPAKDNPFYFIQEDTPLYTDKDCKTPATEVNDNGTPYYFPITYYQGTEKETAVVKRAGSLMSGYVKDIDGAKYLMQGAPRLGNLEDVTAYKLQNETGTASTYREPTFEGVPQTGRFVVYLGNNGRLGITPAEPGTVTATVCKTLTGRDWMDDEKFWFTITPTNEGPLPTGLTPNQDGSATFAIGKPDDGDTNTASLTFTFPAETNFDENGKAVYTYEVTESRGDQPGIDWDGHTATITITVEPDGADADLALDVGIVYDNASDSEDDNGSTDAAVFTNTFKQVSSLPLTGDGTTARNLLAAGGLTLMLAGAAWLLARRRRV